MDEAERSLCEKADAAIHKRSAQCCHAIVPLRYQGLYQNGYIQHQTQNPQCQTMLHVSAPTFDSLTE